MALDLAATHPIAAENQPCTQFGVHPSLDTVARLYGQGDAAFVANVGTLVEPIAGKAAYYDPNKAKPKGLFSHNSQQQGTMSVLAQNPLATGVLGRLLAELRTSKGFVTNSYSIAGSGAKVLGGRTVLCPQEFPNVLHSCVNPPPAY